MTQEHPEEITVETEVADSEEANLAHTVEAIQDGAVLVGHDGSRSAGKALTEAFELGRALGRPVAVIRCFSIATAPRTKDWSFGYVPSIDEITAVVVDELVADTAPARTQFPDVAVQLCVVHAAAARTITAASERARLVVMGKRGRGGFQEMVLGSVSEQVVRHAKCPVVVTRT